LCLCWCAYSRTYGRTCVCVVCVCVCGGGGVCGMSGSVGVCEATGHLRAHWTPCVHAEGGGGFAEGPTPAAHAECGRQTLANCMPCPARANVHHSALLSLPLLLLLLVVVVLLLPLLSLCCCCCDSSLVVQNTRLLQSLHFADTAQVVDEYTGAPTTLTPTLSSPDQSGMATEREREGGSVMNAH
jgi:hypothetical protein